MKTWISIVLLNLAILPPLHAAQIEFSYRLDGVLAGTGSFDYDYLNTDNPVSNYYLNDSYWGTASYSSSIVDEQRKISIRTTRGSSFASITLISDDSSSPVFPETLSLDNFISGSLVTGSAFSGTLPVYTLVSLGEPLVIPLPASIWLFVSGLIVLTSASIRKFNVSVNSPLKNYILST